MKFHLQNKRIHYKLDKILESKHFLINAKEKRLLKLEKLLFVELSIEILF